MENANVPSIDSVPELKYQLEEARRTFNVPAGQEPTEKQVKQAAEGLLKPATEPLDIILLVDDSQAATASIPYIRDGLTKFVDRLQGKAKIGIVLSAICGPPQ